MSGQKCVVLCIIRHRQTNWSCPKPSELCLSTQEERGDDERHAWTCLRGGGELVVERPLLEAGPAPGPELPAGHRVCVCVLISPQALSLYFATSLNHHKRRRSGGRCNPVQSNAWNQGAITLLSETPKGQVVMLVWLVLERLVYARIIRSI